MGAPRKFDPETRERAARMYRDRLAAEGGSKLAAREHVGALLDTNQATMRNWVEKDTPIVTALRVTSVVEQASIPRRRTDFSFTATVLVHHSDAGRLHTALAFTEALRESGIAGSIGSVGDALDYALMESAIGLYKTELIDRQRF